MHDGVGQPLETVQTVAVIEIGDNRCRTSSA